MINRLLQLFDETESFLQESQSAEVSLFLSVVKLVLPELRRARPREINYLAGNHPHLPPFHSAGSLVRVPV